jgi:hypothetical protein
MTSAYIMELSIQIILAANSSGMFCQAIKSCAGFSISFTVSVHVFKLQFQCVFRLTWLKALLIVFSVMSQNSAHNFFLCFTDSEMFKAAFFFTTYVILLPLTQYHLANVCSATSH